MFEKNNSTIALNICQAYISKIISNYEKKKKTLLMILIKEKEG